MPRDDEYLAFGQVLEMLAQDNVPISSSVLYALSGLGTAATRQMREYWPSLPAARRRRIIETLVESAEANFELDFNAVFRSTLQDQDGRIRQLSIDGLWEDQSVTLVSPLVRALREDPEPLVRAAAAASLGRFVLLAELDELEERRAQLVREALLETARNVHESLDVRRRSVESIAYYADPGVHTIIAEAYADDREAMRLSAVFAMGRSADTGWASIVLQELSSSDPAMRYEAARASGELEIKAAVPALTELIDDPDREIQLAAITSLGQIGGASARKMLEQCVLLDDEILCEAAEDALREIMMTGASLDLLVIDPEDGAGGDDDLDIEDLDEDLED